jgi:hypothetical protein
MMSKTIQILLKRLEVGENGEDANTTATTLLSVSLICPNPLTQQRSTVKSVKLADNANIDYAGGTNPATGQPYSFEDRVFFKETIQGRTALTVSLATVHKTSKFETLLGQIFGAVFGAAWKLLVGGITNVFANAAVEAVGSAHVKSFEAGDEKSNAIGDAVLEFDDGHIPSSPLRLPLTVPDDVFVKRLQGPAGGGAAPQQVSVKILAKGQNNGFIELEVTEV